MRLSIFSSDGFTLIELMVTLIIVTIISQIALWYSSDFLAQNRLENHINLLHKHINYGRLYAIENATYVTLCGLRDNQCEPEQWHTQLSLFIDKDKSTTLDDDELVLSTFEKVHEADSLDYPRNAITFRPDGTLNGFQNGTFVYCPNNKANIEGLALSVSQTGRIRIKSTDECNNI